MKRSKLAEWIAWVLVPLILVGGTFWGGYEYRSLVGRVASVEKLLGDPSAPLRFGQWEQKSHTQMYIAESDGFVVVRSHGGMGPAEEDFEILVGTEEPLTARTRGGSHQGATSPVPSGSRWQVRRGGSSNSGSMDVFWIPLLQTE